MVKGNERDLKRRLVEKYNDDAIYKLYVSDVTTPAGKLFYEISIFRAQRYDRTGEKDDEGVNGCEITVTVTNYMEENEKTSANHDRDIVSYIKGGCGG